MTCHADGYPSPYIKFQLTSALLPLGPMRDEEREVLSRQRSSSSDIYGRNPGYQVDVEPTGLFPKHLSNLDMSKFDQEAGGLDPDMGARMFATDPSANYGHRSKVDVASSISANDRTYRQPDDSDRRMDEDQRNRLKRLRTNPDDIAALVALGTSAKHFNLLKDKYVLSGAKFHLLPNATPGVELLLTCSAWNRLPTSDSFLGMNHTKSEARFIIAGELVCILLDIPHHLFVPSK
ncbi:unnamed protein product [Protopolystoma xenopodis]|uniref:Uncharacterized protein n=1 Tax=Protopolystoma xenopodis TaxID=117903 RepID=A0A3S5A196_9PLAT|nr:unnamed protein product [Protopolystoma xenopodis]